MIIFTEHKEVVMNLDDLRIIIRKAYEQGHYDANAHPTNPISFGMERWREEYEKSIRARRMA